MTCVTYKAGNRHTTRHHRRKSSALKSARQNRYTDPLHTVSAERRHTFAHDWLEGGGAEGDLMRLMGWEDRSMLDRYGADLQIQRAVQAKRRRGDLY
jgi:integrase